MIRHLPYFVVVAEEQHFQRAAQRLNIAQPALSRRIRNLEQELGGVPLFVRTPRGVRLTPSGEALLEDARRILASADKARERAQSIMKGDVGGLRVGCSMGALRHAVIGDLLAAFRSAFPGIRLEAELLSIDEQLSQLRDGRIDAGIFYADAVDGEFDSIELAEEDYLLALPARHPLAKAARIRLADVANEDFIFYSRGMAPTMNARLHAAFAEGGVVPKVAMESPGADTTLKLVAAGMGLGFAPASEASKTAKGVVLRPVEDMVLKGHFRLVWLRANPSPILPRLIDAASAVLPEHKR
jgi:DNA-binding transcriptional LysR family regulator